MADATPLAALLDQLGDALEAAVEYCATHRANPARSEEGWTAAQLPTHFIYYHNVAAWGIHSVALGMSPWRNPWLADQINAVCMPLHEAETPEELALQLRLAQRRLCAAVTATLSPDAIVHHRADGETVTLRQRLTETLTHYRNHLQSLRDAVSTG